MKNEVILTVKGLSYHKETGILLAEPIGGTRKPCSNPLRCELQPGVSCPDFTGQPVLLLTGRLCSRDIFFPKPVHPCTCGRRSSGAESVETYLEITVVQPAGENARRNEVQVDGILVQAPSLVKTPHHDFYSARIALPDQKGYITVTYPAGDVPGQPPADIDTGYEVGSQVSFSGYLKFRDYRKRVGCSACHTLTEYPMLNLLVIARSI